MEHGTSFVTLPKTKENNKKVMDALNKVEPFCFLPENARKSVKEKSELLEYADAAVIYHREGKPTETDRSTFIVVEGMVAGFLDDIVEGEISGVLHVGEPYELISEDSTFGLDYAVLGDRRKTTRKAWGGPCTVVAIPNTVMHDTVLKSMEARVSIARTFMEKVPLNTELSAFKSTVRHGVSCGKIELPKLLEGYRKIRPVLHQKVLDDDKLDTAAWAYAVTRLPESLTTAHSFVISTRLPDWIGDTSQLNTLATGDGRARQAYHLGEGQTAVILRESETDMLDFVSNLCIHCIEARKLRRKLRCYQLSNPQWRTSLQSECEAERIPLLTAPETDDLVRMWGKEQLYTRMKEVIFHQENYQINMLDFRTIKPDRLEHWTHQLWDEARKVLHLPDNIVAPGDIRECEEFRVDVIQGTTRTAKNLIAAPHIHNMRHEILTWGRKELDEQRLNLCIPGGSDETDELYAFAYHYWKKDNHRYEEKPINELQLPEGVVELEHKDTGVKLMLVNVKTLTDRAKSGMDPELSGICATVDYHLLVIIGCPFGAQSAVIMRCLISLFGKKLHSMNIIGKAGGIKEGVGIGDILIADSVVNDDPHDLVKLSTKYTDRVEESVEKFMPEHNVHRGPMLTVAGTILQDKSSLEFHRNVMDCIGVEMEAYYFAKEIAGGKERGLLDSISEHFFYSISDLPLEKSKNLAEQRDSLNFNEGVTSLTRCYRACFHCIFQQNHESRCHGHDPPKKKLREIATKLDK